jgi:hypothetical protein
MAKTTVDKSVLRAADPGWIWAGARLRRQIQPGSMTGLDEISAEAHASPAGDNRPQSAVWRQDALPRRWEGVSDDGCATCRVSWCLACRG